MWMNSSEGKDGAGTRNRTRDLLITSQLLYQLSYTGTRAAIVCKLAPLGNGNQVLQATGWREMFG